jgi:IS5 family transposase
VNLLSFRDLLSFVGSGDADTSTRWCQRLGEAWLEELLAQTIAAARSKAVAARDLSRVIVDTTVQEKAVAHPTDSRLLEVARRKRVLLSKRHDLRLRQTYERVGPGLSREAGRHAYARQFKRMRRVLRRQRTLLGRVIRDIGCKLKGMDPTARVQMAAWRERADALSSSVRMLAKQLEQAEGTGKSKACSAASWQAQDADPTAMALDQTVTSH